MHYQRICLRNVPKKGKLSIQLSFKATEVPPYCLGRTEKDELSCQTKGLLAQGLYGLAHLHIGHQSCLSLKTMLGGEYASIIICVISKQ